MLTDFPAMQRALIAAEKAAHKGGVPVGAAITDKHGRIIAVAANNPLGRCDPTAHAEIAVIRQAASTIKSDRLINYDLWVTLEPCAMCAGAISHARIRRLYFGAEDPKGGAVLHGPRLFEQPTIHHRPEIYPGIMAEASAALLQKFFRGKR